MKRKALLVSALYLGTMFLISCGGGASEEAHDHDHDHEHDTKTETPAAPEASMNLEAGKKVYDAKCMACHQANGEGLSGTFPPLAASDFLLEDKARAIKTTINGNKEAITVNGVEYPGGTMTVQELTDQEVVDVVNYILNSWGNNGGTVTLEDVKAAKE